MKIALVARHGTPPTHALDPYSADQAAQVVELGRALAEQGHEVVIYTRKDSEKLPGKMTLGKRLTAEFIPVGPAAPVPADQLPKYAKEMAAQLAARWRRRTPDVVHAFHWTAALAALAAANETPVPVTVSFGSLAAAEQRQHIAGEVTPTRLRMEACIAKAAAGVIATTSDEVAELSRLGVPGKLVSLIPAGVDASAFTPAGYAAKRKKNPRLLTVGSLAEYRGLETVLRCLTELPDAELVIAGGPIASDLEADHGYRILAKLAAHLGVADRVEFTGHVADKDLPALLRSADVLISNTRYEPMGLTAIRAMACGVPVVATDVGTYSDAIIDGTTGMLVPPGRPHALARRLHDLLAYPMRRAALGIAAADRAKSRYPWERISTETVAVYERSITQALSQVPAARTTAGQVRTLRPAAQPVSKRAVLVSASGHAA
jgi:D-inositol-3-phosphate glycosyltransferase